jgi:metal-sulfur cluster biosynthetic enzyme
MPTQEQVYEALKEVNDPELHLGIVDLGLVYGVDVEGEQNENVTVTMTLTSPMCPVGPMFKKSVEDSVLAVEGVKTANVEITFTPPWDPRTMADRSTEATTTSIRPYASRTAVAASASACSSVTSASCNTTNAACRGIPGRPTPT